MCVGHFTSDIPVTYVQPIAMSHTTVYITPAPHGPIFHARYLHSWSSSGAKKVGVGNISPRVFRTRIVWYRHPLGLSRHRAWKTAPEGCDMHRSRTRYTLTKKRYSTPFAAVPIHTHAAVVFRVHVQFQELYVSRNCWLLL